MSIQTTEEKRRKQTAHMRQWRINHAHPCIDCGKPIDPRYKRCRPCRIAKMRGQNHPNWKGGKSTYSRGYVVVLAPSHPRASPNGYVLEHILVWEEAHGKPLPKGWIIHHLNGIKSDNRSQNLVAMPNKKHYLVLQAKAKRIQELEALLNNQHQLL